MQAWRVEVRVRSELPDPQGLAAQKALAGAGFRASRVRSLRGYLLGDQLEAAQVEQFAREVLADPVVDEVEILAPGEAGSPTVPRVSILLRQGVTDPVARSVRKALGDAGLPVVPAATYRAFDLSSDRSGELRSAAQRALANEVIHEVLVDTVPGELPDELPGRADSARMEPQAVGLLDLEPQALLDLSRRKEEFALGTGDFAIGSTGIPVGASDALTELEIRPEVFVDLPRHLRQMRDRREQLGIPLE